MTSNLKKLSGLLTRFIVITFLIFTGCSSDDSEESDPDTGTPSTSNTLTANAGIDQNVGENNLVTLDGSESSDSNGETFSYSWTLLSQPSESDVALSNTNTTSPTFTPNISGIYVIELEISNNDFTSTDTVTIMVTEVNTEIVEIGGTINEDIVLRNLVDTPGVADYCITSDINLEAVMTIEPGVELHFDADLSFIVRGNSGGILIAKGTAENPITFTAKDTNLPWRGIGIVLSDDFRNEMDYVNISYAGIDDLSNIDRRAALGISSFSALKFTNSTISNSAEIGMFVEDRVELTFENNRFENNAKAPLVLPADQVGQLDTASQFGLINGEDMIEVTGRNGSNVNLAEPTFWKPMDDGTSYFVTDSLVIDSELNIMPGVELYFDADKSMRIDGNGILIANGTEELPIIFTAKNPNLPWRGIGIYSDSTRNIIDYGVISYAGVDTVFNLDERVAIGIGSFESLALTNSTISNSVNNGMLVEDSANLLNFSNNIFENNAGTPLIITAGQVHNLDTASTFGTTNGNDYIEILGDFLDGNTSSDEITWTAFDDNTPYYLTGNLSFQSSFRGLNISPRVKIMVGSDLNIRVGGSFLSAKGESEAGRITFTAFDQSLPWQGISFVTKNVRNELDFVEVSYAGSDQLGNIPVLANVGVFGFNNLTVTNSIISNGLGYGLSLDDNADVNLDIETSNTIIDNVLGPVFFDE